MYSIWNSAKPARLPREGGRELRPPSLLQRDIPPKHDAQRLPHEQRYHDAHEGVHPVGNTSIRKPKQVLICYTY